MRGARAAVAVYLAAALSGGSLAAAQEPPPQPETSEAATPPQHLELFLGYESEPAMDYGGRVVASAQAALSRAFARIGDVDVGAAHPGLAPVWEFPLAGALLLVQHEVLGHGARARELSLSPSYSFGLDFSGGTSTARPPEDHRELALLATGGTEADGVLAHRLLLESLASNGVDAAQIPLAMMAKLDLSLYVSSVPSVDDEDDFTDEYRNGNDMAIYLVGRQADRRGVPAPEVWNGTYEPDFAENALRDSRDDLRSVALWNLLDPSLVAAMVGYFRQHVLHGTARVHAPALRIGDELRLTVGTRAALGPQEMSRFLDLAAAGRWGVLDVYARDLRSGTDTRWGYGAALHGLRLGSVALSLGGDVWDEPPAVEGPGASGRWNAVLEAEWRPGRWALAAKLGSKSAGFFPGLPEGDGTYAGVGVVLLPAW